MGLPATNMLKQSPYRKKLKVGDVFRLAYPKNQFIFGQVISLSASAGGFEDCIKIYVYDFVSDNGEIPNEIKFDKLICEPLFINRLGFSRGYMPVISNKPISDNLNSKEWCFKDVFNRFFSEDGHKLEKPTELVGTWGLSNYLVLDDLVSKVLELEVVDSET